MGLDNNFKHMWEQVKQKIVESAREVFGSVKVWEKNPKSVQWNDKVKAAVKRKEDAWKVLQLAMKRQKKDVWEHTEKRNAKRCIYQSKNEANEVWKEYE